MASDFLVERTELDFNEYLAAETFPPGAIVGPGEIRDRVEAYSIPPGIPLPWQRTNYFALRAREWSVFGGYTSHGKTSALLHVCLHAIAQGKRVAIANLEHGAEETVLAMQLLAGCRGDLLRTDSFYELIDDRLKVLNIAGSLTPDEAFTFAWSTAAKWGADVVVIDNLAALKTQVDGPTYLTTQTRFAQELNGLCTRYPVHVVLVAHGRKPSDSRPMGLYEVSGTSNLVNLTWNVLTIHRNMKKHMDLGGAGEEDGALFVWKQRRGGEIGKVRLWRDARTAQFVEVDAIPVEYL